MRNINLIDSISEIQDISQGIEGLAKIEMCEVKSLINKGFVCESLGEIISFLEHVEGELLNISKEMKSIN